MGISIGAAARSIASIAPAGLNRLDRGIASNRDTEVPGQLVRPEESPEIRAGFGENTLSPSGAALKTLDSNLEAAQELVPTVQELRDRARAAQAARAIELEARAEAARPTELRRRESVRPEPNPAARFFVQESDTPAPPVPAPADRADTAVATETDATAIRPAEQPERTSEVPSPDTQAAPARTPGARLDLQA